MCQSHIILDLMKLKEGVLQLIQTCHYIPDSYITSATLNQPVTIPSSIQMISASIGSEKVIGSDLNMRASIIGGVLGSIIIILLLLLAMCGGALLFLLRSRSTTPKM